jgi:hypothetical protein
MKLLHGMLFANAIAAWLTSGEVLDTLAELPY